MRAVSMCLAAILLAPCAGRCRADAPPPRDYGPRTTDHDTYVERVGSWLVVYLRRADAPRPDLAARAGAWQQFAGGQPAASPSDGQHPRFLQSAFDDAEGAMDTNHQLYRVTRRRNVRLIIVPDPVVNACVLDRPLGNAWNCLDIVVTEAMLDFIDATAQGLLVDQEKAGGSHLPGIGFYRWIEALRRGEVAGFRPGSARPGPPPSWMTPRRHAEAEAMSSAICAFLFAHELAHRETGLHSTDDPGASLQREIEVDRFALRRLISISRARPYTVCAFLMALHHYERYKGEAVQAYTRAIAAGTDPLPARNWQRRAQELADEWERCSALFPNSSAYHDGWRNALEQARVLTWGSTSALAPAGQ